MSKDENKSINISIRNSSISNIDMEIISFGMNPIKGGTLPSIAIMSMMVEACFVVMWVFILFAMNGIIIAVIIV